MADTPATLQLRYLQTLTEIGAEKNTTVVFPIPVDIVQMFLEGGSRREAQGRREIPARQEPQPEE
jgi:hypothetical protein